MRRSGGCAGTSCAGNGQAAYENHQPEKVLLSPLRNGHFHRTAGRDCRRIVEEWRADHNSEQRLWSHTYSMDYSPGLEYHLLYHALSAEDTLLEEETRREQEEAHELMLQRLREALATLTPTQARRLHARFVEGKKYREIAEDEGIASVSLLPIPSGTLF